MINENYKYSALTEAIIGCAFEVHKILGNGFQEVIYQRALENEFALRNIKAIRELEMGVFYKGKSIGTRRVDFLVENNICGNQGCSKNSEDVHFAQAINYLEAYNLEIGMLFNFGSKAWNSSAC